jgi:acyl-CoA synthetase
LDVWPEGVVREYHDSGYWDDRTLSEVLRGHAASNPDGVAFYGPDGEATTWSEYDRKADEVAAEIAGLGFDRGTGVAVMLPDSAVLHAAFVGVERAGHFVAAIAHRAGLADIAEVLRRSEAVALVTTETHDRQDTRSLVDQLRGDGRWSGAHLVIRDDGGIEGGNGSAGAALDEARPLTADELFLVNFTSGTTGAPKCVMHTQNRWKYFHTKAVQFRPDDVFLVGIPATGGFGLWMSHFSPLLLGAPTVLMESFSAEKMLAQIERHGVTVVVAVPTQMHMLMRSPALATTDLSTLRIIQSGGEHVPYEESARFEELTGAAVLQFYGSTEAGCVSGPTSADDTRERRLNTSGRPIPEMNLRLFDENGDDVTAQGRGRCGVRGPAMTPGYFGDPEATAELYRDDGWVLTGDVVEVDAQGYLHVVGRISDFIIRGGLNVSAAAVEDAVRSHPRIAEVAAVRMADPEMGERVCAFVSTVDGEPIELEELRPHLSANQVTKSLWPERLVCLDELPVAAGGKLAKKQLEREIDAILAREAKAAASG